MEKKIGFLQRMLSVAAVLGLSFLIVSCGGNKNPDSAPSAPVPNGGAAPSAPGPLPPPPVAQGLGGFIEDQSPGTPVGNDAASWNNLTKRFQDNVSFYGSATVSTVIAFDYFLENAYTSTVKFTRSNQQNLPNQSPTLQIQAYGDSIYIQSPYSVSQSYFFQPQISLFGLVLNSTDSVGLYLSKDGSSLLKVQYNTRNPAIQQYAIENTGGYWNSVQLRITQKVINTSGTYNPQVPH